jgi:hypothetical protein
MEAEITSRQRRVHHMRQMKNHPTNTVTNRGYTEAYARYLQQCKPGSLTGAVTFQTATRARKSEFMHK